MTDELNILQKDHHEDDPSPLEFLLPEALNYLPNTDVCNSASPSSPTSGMIG